MHRKIASLLFPLPTRLRGNADDLITGAAALLAPVAFLPEALSLYRIHGDNLFAARFLAEYDRAHHGASPGEPAPGAASSAPFEDVDLYDEKQRRIRLSEEQARFGNEVLQRAGLPGALSPWSSPLYRTFRLSLVKSQRFTFLLPVLRAYGSMRPVPIWKRVLQGTKALKAVLRGAP